MINLKAPYQPRPIRFLELFEFQGWTIKIYSISIFNEFVGEHNVDLAKQNLSEWLKKSTAYQLETYQLATLIIHEYREGCFAIINWWTDENMLQNFVYLRRNSETEFHLFSGEGITTCVWEMAVLWHERNAWVKHILTQYDRPNVEGYLAEQLNETI
jgi:hypothetical protein